MAEINFDRCSQNAETCPVVQEMMELDAFYEAVGDMEEASPEVRRVLQSLFIACANGICPGQSSELLDRLNRRIGEVKHNND